MKSKGALVFIEKRKIFWGLLEDQLYTVGRSSSDDFFLASKGISRTHASICLRGDSFWIIDGSIKGNSSTNGLFVNGEKVSLHRLKTHDIITFHKDSKAIFFDQKDSLKFDDEFSSFLNHLTTFLSQDAENTSEAKNSNLKSGAAISQIQDSHLHPQKDDLTGLPNRKAFLSKVEKTLEIKKKISEDHQFAIFFIDVDRFKMINDSLGHLAGDKFLIELAERFKACIRPYDMAARLSGDEFAILLNNIEGLEEAITVAKRLQSNIAKPLTLIGQEVYPSISIGIASSQLPYETVEDILRDADTAMYNAKRAGRSRFAVFDESMHQKTKELQQLDSDLRHAVANQQLQLYYQPIISLGLRKLVGFEALIHWNHPERGLVSPDAFIPIAEETNLIYQIGLWAIQEVCWQLASWKKNTAIQIPLSVNVNLSARQLSDSNLVRHITETITEHGIDSDEIKLEITESIAMENSQQTIKVFSQLRQIGVPLVIDGFGTGYSSLSDLNRFPIDTLKIDESFVSQINPDNENTSINITHSIIGLAHSLGVKVVAEGIQNEDHMSYLRQVRCDYGQGDLFGKPLTAEAATSWAEQGLDWRWTPENSPA